MRLLSHKKRQALAVFYDVLIRQHVTYNSYFVVIIINTCHIC